MSFTFREHSHTLFAGAIDIIGRAMDLLPCSTKKAVAMLDGTMFRLLRDAAALGRRRTT